MGFSSGDITERFQWTYPIVIAPTNPDVLYVTSQHVWKSINEGQSWQRISPDLTRHDPSTLGPSGGPITLDQTGVETYATIFTLAPSAVDGNVLWAGSDDGLVHVTRDGGQELAERHAAGPATLHAHQPYRSLAPQRRLRRTWPATGISCGDRAPYVYKTADSGKTWTKIANGLTGENIARAIREDKKRSGLLFLGTDTGIYVSFDDGAAWQSLQLDLPVTPVHGIEVRNDDVLLGTHGRSFYSLDNIGVLRQISRETTNEPVVLFHPSDATRSISRGVAIDYYLKQAADKVTVEILDPQAKSIVTFTGTPPESGGREGRGAAPAAAPEPDEEGGGRGGPPATVNGQAGDEPVQLGYAIPERARLPGVDHVGRQRTRPAGAARKVPSEVDRSRRHENAGLRDQAQCGRADCHRRGPPRAVQAREGDQRQGHHRERGSDQNPESESADSGSDRQERAIGR